MPRAAGASSKAIAAVLLAISILVGGGTVAGIKYASGTLPGAAEQEATIVVPVHPADPVPADDRIDRLLKLCEKNAADILEINRRIGLAAIAAAKPPAPTPTPANASKFEERVLDLLEQQHKRLNDLETNVGITLPAPLPAPKESTPKTPAERPRARGFANLGSTWDGYFNYPTKGVEP